LDERSPDLPSASRRKYGFNKGKSIHAEMRGIEWDADTMQPEPGKPPRHRRSISDWQ